MVSGFFHVLNLYCLHSLIAGKPAPTGIVVDHKCVFAKNSVGAGLPAMNDDSVSA
jgi:hypothetical protein